MSKKKRAILSRLVHCIEHVGTQRHSEELALVTA